MTTDDIKTVANTLAESKGSKLDLDTLLLHRIQEFCRASHFDWRRKTGTFSTVAGTASYDLSSSSYANIDDLEEVIAVLYVQSVSNVVEVDPVEDPIAVEQARADTSTTGEPAGYFILPGTFFTIQFTPIPAGTYAIRIPYWAIPNTIDGSSVVPLVPAAFHHCLVKGLKMDIWANAFGESSNKYQVAAAEYQESVLNAIAKKNFNSGRVVQFKSRESAVRSTR